MGKVTEFLRVLFVSLEFLLCLLLLLAYQNGYQVFHAIGENILAHDDVVTWLPILPISLCGTAVYLAFKLLSPVSSSCRTLYDWPDYWRLKLRRNVSLFWPLLAGITVVSIWILRSEIKPAQIAFLFSLSIGVSLISCGSQLLASFELKEMLEE
jgi:hypothetical protein